MGSRQVADPLRLRARAWCRNKAVDVFRIDGLGLVRTGEDPPDED
jgi:hypothetical protein